jgi:hypothetical protein
VVKDARKDVRRPPDRIDSERHGGIRDHITGLGRAAVEQRGPAIRTLLEVEPR